MLTPSSDSTSSVPMMAMTPPETARSSGIMVRSRDADTWPSSSVSPVSCPRNFWTPICPTGGNHDEVEHEPNRTHRCE